MMMGLPSAMGTVMQGLILFPMLAGSLFTEYRIRILGRKARESKGTCAEGEA
jgi:simple sugar transport system permease protein